MLNHVTFALLGLGDSNYDTFQGFPKKLFGRLTELGARPFLPRREADEATGLEDSVEPWINDELWPALEELFEKRATAEVPQSSTAQALLPEGPQTQNTNATSTSAATSSKPEKHKKDARQGHKSDKKAAVPKPIPQVSKLEFHSAYTKDKPFMATILRARILTSPEALKTVYHVELSLGQGSGFNLRPGDSIGILCPNTDRLVTGLLRRLSVDGDRLISLVPRDAAVDQSTLPTHIKTPCSIREALTHYCDLTSLPSKRFLRTLANYCNNPSDRDKLIYLSSSAGREDFVKELEQKRPSILDLLNEFPSCQPPLDHLFDCLPPMKPRYYSLACSPLVHPNQVHFAFTLVDIRLPNSPKANDPNEERRFRGVCTNWLAQLLHHSGILVSVAMSPSSPTSPTETIHMNNSFSTYSSSDPKANESNNIGIVTSIQKWTSPSRFTADLYEFAPKIPIFPYLTKDFVLPNEPHIPIIMVGPGTGVAPFLSFLQHRRALRQQSQSSQVSVRFGESWLFYGCRHPDKDFLYKEELNSFVKDGTLTHLITAFSRFTDKVIYVQNRIEEYGQQIMDLMLHQNAHFYICGDARGMATGVRATIIKILEEHYKKSTKEAEETLSQWVTQRRYILDVWS